MRYNAKDDDDGWREFELIRGNRYSGCRVTPPAVIEFRAHPPPSTGKQAPAKYLHSYLHFDKDF